MCIVELSPCLIAAFQMSIGYMHVLETFFTLSGIGVQYCHTYNISFVLCFTEFCDTGNNNCDITAICNPTTNGFTCSCNTDYQGDGTNCTRKFLSPTATVRTRVSTLGCTRTVSCGSITILNSKFCL